MQRLLPALLLSASECRSRGVRKKKLEGDLCHEGEVIERVGMELIIILYREFLHKNGSNT